MTKITTTDNAIHINDAYIPKDSREINKLVNGVRVTNINTNEYLDIKVIDTTIDGVQVTSVQELMDYFEQKAFN